jgi:hypothetical protein
MRFMLATQANARPSKLFVKLFGRAYEIPISRQRQPSRFFMGIGPILSAPILLFGEAVMSFDPNQLQLLGDRLRHAPSAGPEIFGAVIDACTRIPVLRTAGKAGRLDQLLAAGAWTDAALALIELEFPAWTLRRLVYEDGEWFCSLSQQPNLPLAIDDIVDAHHPVLPLAILSALIEVGATAELRPQFGAHRVPQVRPATGYAVCCDNFA